MIEWDDDIEYDVDQAPDAVADVEYEYKARMCRVCGCTDQDGCPGGCWWVEADLCSACQGGDDG